MTRAKRNQVVRGTLRNDVSSMLPRSRVMSPNPPFWTRTSAALNACSSGFNRRDRSHRTHSRWERSTPAAAADAGSKASVASIQAQHSCLRASCAMVDTMSVVLPTDTFPAAQICVRAPRGRPPVMASREAIPVGILCSSMRRYGVSAPGTLFSTWARITAIDVIRFQPFTVRTCCRE